MKKLIILILLLYTKQFYGQKDFKPVKLKQLNEWITVAKNKSEINPNAVPNLHDNHELALKNLDDSNALFNYGLSLTTVLQPGLAKATENPMSAGAKSITDEAESAYKAAIELFSGHGRANIMLGMLYNQIGKYDFSDPYLEVGLRLKEGEEDWMVAANQYLLAGAYTYNTKEDDYQKVYNKFKKYAKTDIKDGSYYKKMAVLYLSYYER